eukprot:6787868-Prymnesium_polylepis.1
MARRARWRQLLRGAQCEGAGLTMAAVLPQRDVHVDTVLGTLRRERKRERTAAQRDSRSTGQPLNGTAAQKGRRSTAPSRQCVGG